MEKNEKVKIVKGSITKEIQKKDLPLYINLGWHESNVEIRAYDRVNYK